MATWLVGMHMGIWDHAPMPLPHWQPGRLAQEHVVEGAPRQRGQHGLYWRSKAVSGETARALDILPASNMGSAVSMTMRAGYVNHVYS